MPRRKITTKPKRALVKKKPVRNKEDLNTAVKDIKIELGDEMKTEREKMIAMWAGVIFFMVIILAFWAISFKNNVKGAIKETSQSGAGFSEAINNFNKSLEETKSSFSNFQSVLENNFISKEESATTEVQIQELEQRLKEMEEKIKLDKLLYQLNNELNKDNKTE